MGKPRLSEQTLDFPNFNTQKNVTISPRDVWGCDRNQSF